MAGDRFDKRAFALVIGSFDGAIGDSVLFKRVRTFGIVNQRGGIIPILVDHHKPLFFDCSHSGRFHIGAVGFILLFQNIHLIRFERCAGITLYTADPFAARQIATETGRENLGTDDFIVNLNHESLILYPVQSFSNFVKRDTE